MPSEQARYAVLSNGSRLLVATAGLSLQRTSFAFLPPTARRGGKPAVVIALEQCFAPQRSPQRTILGAFGAAVGHPENDVSAVVASSVGQLWRDGWRCERDVASHALKFLRDAPEGHGPSGEILGVRSYVDFAHVLMEWHTLQSEPNEAALNDHDVVEILSETEQEQEAEQRICSSALPQGKVELSFANAHAMPDDRPVKRSRFFAATSSASSTSKSKITQDHLGLVPDAGG